MIRRTAEVAATGMLVGAALIGTSQELSDIPRQDKALFTEVSDTYTTEQKAFILDERDDIVRTRGELSTTSLVLFDGKGFRNCADVGRVTKNPMIESGPSYCHRNDRVGMTAGALGSLVRRFAHEDPEAQAAMTDFFVNHEYGHARQKREGMQYNVLNDNEFAWEAGERGKELQADCYAGQQMATNTSYRVQIVGRILLTFPSLEDDGLHGSPLNRSESFLAGARGSDCAIQDEISDYPDLVRASQATQQ